MYREKEEAARLKAKFEQEEAEARILSQKKLAEYANRGAQRRSRREVKIVYYRNPYLKELVKSIADGRCQMCHINAPFVDKEQKPYLEEHHVQRLADGGSDTIDNVVALCPNCHRKVHIVDSAQLILQLYNIAEENKKKYERLFNGRI